jgi:hypothetical protein
VINKETQREKMGRAVAGSSDPAGATVERRPFVAPCLTRHEPLVNITLLSDTDWDGGGGAGGTLFGG